MAVKFMNAVSARLESSLRRSVLSKRNRKGGKYDNRELSRISHSELAKWLNEVMNKLTRIAAGSWEDCHDYLEENYLK